MRCLPVSSTSCGVFEDRAVRRRVDEMRGSRPSCRRSSYGCRPHQNAGLSTLRGLRRQMGGGARAESHKSSSAYGVIVDPCGCRRHNTASFVSTWVAVRGSGRAVYASTNGVVGGSIVHKMRCRRRHGWWSEDGTGWCWERRRTGNRRDRVPRSVPKTRRQERSRMVLKVWARRAVESALGRKHGRKPQRRQPWAKRLGTQTALSQYLVS